MTTYRLSPRAKQDISEIWKATVERWSAGQAEFHIRQIQASIDDAAEDASKDPLLRRNPQRLFQRHIGLACAVFPREPGRDRDHPHPPKHHGFRAEDLRADAPGFVGAKASPLF